MRRQSPGLIRLLYVLFLLILVEISALAALVVLRNMAAARFLLYAPPPLNEAAYADYLAIRDPLLGWPSPRDIGGPRFDSQGSRRIPAFPLPGQECLSLYGDSFVYSTDVEDIEAWGNLLAKRLGCRAANFGVPGYGTDQAYLRFKRNESDVAPISILGFYPRNVMRNITRYAHFGFGDTPKAFKPRFAIEMSELKFVPIPEIEVRDLQAFLVQPERFLEDEELLPDTRLGPTRIRFPFSFSLARTMSDYRVINRIRGRPSWISLLSEEHPAQGLEITLGIIEHFMQLCDERKKECFVLFFPTPSSYRHYRSTRRLAVEGLIDGLEAKGIDYLSLSEGLEAYLSGRSYCELVTSNCMGHHNREGEEVVAQLVHEHLEKRGYLSRMTLSRDSLSSSPSDARIPPAKP